MKMYKLYGYIQDGGDGSASLHWTSDPNGVDLDDEEYYMNEGGWAEILQFPSSDAARDCGLVWEGGDLENYP